MGLLPCRTSEFVERDDRTGGKRVWMTVNRSRRAAGLASSRLLVYRGRQTCCWKTHAAVVRESRESRSQRQRESCTVKPTHTLRWHGWGSHNVAARHRASKHRYEKKIVIDGKREVPCRSAAYSTRPQTTRPPRCTDQPPNLSLSLSHAGLINKAELHKKTIEKKIFHNNQNLKKKLIKKIEN